MSAIPTDAADIPTALSHPTGAATVINSNSVASNSNTTSNPTASPSSSPSSVSPSRPASRDSQLPLPRDFSLDAHQAEYRTHAYLANESIVATKLAADKFLQNLFKTQTEPDTDILRAASTASRARLQNPFAYNNSRSSGSSSGSSGSSAGSSSYYSGSSGSSSPRSSSSGLDSSSPPRSPSNPPQTQRPISPASAPQSTPTAPATPIAPAPAAPLAPTALATAPLAPAPSEADADQPLTETDFADCIKLEDAFSNPTNNQVAAPTPEPASDLAIWKFGHLAISPPAPPCLNLATWSLHPFTITPCITSWPHGP